MTNRKLEFGVDTVAAILLTLAVVVLLICGQLVQSMVLLAWGLAVSAAAAVMWVRCSMRECVDRLYQQGHEDAVQLFRQQRHTIH